MCQQMWQDVHNDTNFNSNPETTQMPIDRKVDTNVVLYLEGFSGSSAGKESVCNAGDPGSIPGLGRSPGEGIGYPLQYSWASLVTQMVKNLYSSEKDWLRPQSTREVDLSDLMTCSIPFQCNSNNYWKQKISLLGIHTYICDKTVS